MGKICRTCLEVLNNDASCLSLDSVSDSNYPSLRNKLSVCVPELELDVIQSAVLCSVCVEALNTSYLFKNKCLQTEQKILDFTRYMECTKDSINVSDLAQFTDGTKSIAKVRRNSIVFCNVKDFEGGNLQEIKIEPGIITEGKMDFHSELPVIQDFDTQTSIHRAQDFETETNNLINSIPFNPELDVEIRGYNAPTVNNMHQFSQPINLNNLNLTTQPFYCVYCQKHFEALPQLQAHLTMHAMQNRPLKCEMCERRFVRKDKLMLHMRIHTGEKPFKCTECGRCFSRKDKLNNHMRTHTGEKPHQCILCQKSFARKDKMNLHMKSQHWMALSNLEITVVKYAENTNGVPQTAPTENLPKIN